MEAARKRSAIAILGGLLLVGVPHPSSTQAGIVVGLGQGGAGWVEVLAPTAPYAHQAWFQVPWSTYNSANGETRPVTCDVDGDGRDEVVLGLGPFPGNGGWLEVRDDASTGYRHLAWLQVPWAAYNSANGETFPACGDLDGDGKAEIVVGLGAGGGGWLRAFDDATTGYAPLPNTPSAGGWLRLNWSIYNQARGEVHPAVGDLDRDGKAELVLGLGEGGQGWVQVLDDASTRFAPLPGTPTAGGWVRLDWLAYNAANGTTWPAVCTLFDIVAGELVLGVGSGGKGWVQVLDTAGAFASLGWLQLPWAAYNDAVGVTHPACGDLGGDGPEELLLGIGTYPTSGGWLDVRTDGFGGGAHDAWARVKWAGYNSANGLTRPAVERAAAQQFPDIRGNYTGSGSVTLENCQDDRDNITAGFSITASIPNQTGGSFSGGTADLTDTTFPDAVLTEHVEFDGTITTDGRVSGSGTYTFRVDGNFDSSGNVSFSGLLSGNTLTLDTTSQDTVGDTCRGTGTLTVRR